MPAWKDYELGRYTISDDILPPHDQYKITDTCFLFINYKHLISCLGDECIIPPLTTPIPQPDPTLNPDIKTAVQAGEKSASSLLICFLLATIAVFAFMKIYTTSRVIQMNMEISLILAHVLAVILPNLSDNIMVFSLNYFIILIQIIPIRNHTIVSVTYNFSLS